MTVVNYKTNKFEVDEVLQTLVERKLQTLEKFFKNYEEVAVDIEFQQEGASNAGKQYRVEVNLSLDGRLYRAEATEESFERAIDEVRDELDKELRRTSKKQTGLVRRGGRMIKDMLRFGRN
jgi:ribosomal subunit interface protein